MRQRFLDRVPEVRILPPQPATRPIGDGEARFRHLSASSVACQMNLPVETKNSACHDRDLTVVSVLDSGGDSSPPERVEDDAFDKMGCALALAEAAALMANLRGHGAEASLARGHARLPSCRSGEGESLPVWPLQSAAINCRCTCQHAGSSCVFGYSLVRPRGCASQRRARFVPPARDRWRGAGLLEPPRALLHRLPLVTSG